MGRSTAYWSSNRYPTASAEPRPSAPYRDLSPVLAARFRRLREGLRAEAGVQEHLRFMGEQWRWAWEFVLAGRKLCWIHVMQESVSATFTVTAQEERRAFENPRLPTALAAAIKNGQATGPVRWCWLELTDQRTVDALLAFLKRKAGWIRAEPGPAMRRSAAG